MAKPQHQITFDFSDDEQPKEFLSGQPIASGLPKSKSGKGRKSTKEGENEWDTPEIPEDAVLFQKQYYSIGEVAAMFKVNNSLIRYWANEFDSIEPRKNKKGDRFFKPDDVKNIELIYDLVRRRKFTIEGAKDFIKKNKQASEKYEIIQSLQRLRSFLLQLKADL